MRELNGGEPVVTWAEVGMLAKKRRRNAERLLTFVRNNGCSISAPQREKVAAVRPESRVAV